MIHSLQHDHAISHAFDDTVSTETIINTSKTIYFISASY